MRYVGRVAGLLANPNVPPPNLFTPDFGQEPHVVVGRDALTSSLRAGLGGGPRDNRFTSLLLGPRGSGKTVMLNAMRDAAGESGWIVPPRRVTLPSASQLIRRRSRGPNVTSSMRAASRYSQTGLSASQASSQPTTCAGSPNRRHDTRQPLRQSRNDRGKRSDAHAAMRRCPVPMPAACFRSDTLEGTGRAERPLHAPRRSAQ